MNVIDQMTNETKKYLFERKSTSTQAKLVFLLKKGTKHILPLVKTRFRDTVVKHTVNLRELTSYITSWDWLVKISLEKNGSTNGLF